MTERLERITAHLRKLADGSVEPDNWALGICEELNYLFDLWYTSSKKVTMRWPEKYAADDDYPVGGEDEFYGTLNLWGKSIAGDRRRALCKFMADNMTEEDLRP